MTGCLRDLEARVGHIYFHMHEQARLFVAPPMIPP